MNNNENNARFFQIDGQLRYHWGADDEIMTIINRREKSPETTELVRRRIELTVEKSTYQEDQKKMKGEKSNGLTSN